MGTEQLEIAYAGDIVKWEPHPDNDGTILVHGVATDPGEDLDGQGCDPEWLKKAMPEWFKFANIREQHSSVAAGVGKELTHGDGDTWHLTSHIVDPGTIAKVKSRTLKGYSVGIRNGQVLRGKAAGFRNGKIVGGDIVEVSLVDRPCNPRATISICKAAGGTGELEAVEPEFIDIDPSVYDEAPAVVPSDDDDELGAGADDDSDGEQDSQAVGEPVDDGLSLFGDLEIEWDEPPAFTDTDGMFAKAESLLDDVADEDDDAELTISKGLLEQLIHGTKKPKAKRDGDGDGKVGDGESEREKARLARERREREAKRERDHRNRLDAERAQDANRAARAGRRLEAGEHRARLGQYDKALSVLEYRSGVRLVADVLGGYITKGAESVDEAETIAELAELARAEADALATAGYGGPEDVSLLMEACAAIAKMAGVEPVNRRDEAPVLDESSASATLDVAEIVKAQVAEQLSIVREAHEAELATLRAQVTKMAATPLPGGPVIAKFAMPSAPAQSSHQSKAAELERLASNPMLAPDVAEGYRALAQMERAKG